MCLVRHCLHFIKILIYSWDWRALKRQGLIYYVVPESSTASVSRRTSRFCWLDLSSEKLWESMREIYEVLGWVDHGLKPQKVEERQGANLEGVERNDWLGKGAVTQFRLHFTVLRKSHGRMATPYFSIVSWGKFHVTLGQKQSMYFCPFTSRKCMTLQWIKRLVFEIKGLQKCKT